jgi:hypothetical protein
MSKEKDRNLVKKYFKKKPPKSGYFKGRVHLVPEDLAKELEKQGYCRDVTETLPNDLPGRDAFLEAGIETVEEIKELDDLTKVNGIGDATAEDIVEYFKENQ